jgi:hypothetical protein
VATETRTLAVKRAISSALSKASGMIDAAPGLRTLDLHCVIQASGDVVVEIKPMVRLLTDGGREFHTKRDN